MINTVDLQPATLTELSLYGRVLGDRAAALHPQVTALHCSDGKVVARGWMHVRRGPRKSVVLTITRDERGELWTRRFGRGLPIRTRQRLGEPGELLERFGPLTFVFTLELAGAILRFRQRASRLHLGPLTVRLPRWLAPQVQAAVCPAPGGGVWVDVRVTIPLGVLLAYAGTVTVQEAAA